MITKNVSQMRAIALFFAALAAMAVSGLSCAETPIVAGGSETGEEGGGESQPSLPANYIPKSGYYADSLVFTLPPAGGNGAVLCCDTSGGLPTSESAVRSGVTLSLTKTAIMRCAQFKDGNSADAPDMRTYIVGERRPSLPVVSIAVDPAAMFDSVTGLYSMGPNARPTWPHYGANFWGDTELPIQVDFFESGARYVWGFPAGLKIFGQSSRAFPKKSVSVRFRGEYGQKKLNYTLFPEYPRLTKFNSFVLRNNGSTFGKDYIRDMLMTSLTEGLGIDYQKGRAVIVFYNGRYYGIHNLREHATARYFETNYGIDKEFIDLVKAFHGPSNGSDADYQRVLSWVGAHSALSDDDVSTLGEWIDLDNFTNIFQSEIYFMNTDWPGNNMKWWRATAPPTKWKYLLYDTDWGFGAGSYTGGSAVRMLEYLLTDTPSDPENWPNPSRSTLIIRKLMENESYKKAFINRFSLLLATYFAPERVDARIDALMAQIESEVPLDQARWGLDADHMSRELAKIKDFGRTRAKQMQGEMEAFFNVSGAVDLTVSSDGNGTVQIHGLPVPSGGATFKAYPSIPVTINAVPDPGARFGRWSDEDGWIGAERVVTATGATAIRAEFERATGHIFQ